MTLAGKRIILTGGSGGLGRLVADEFVRDGASLTVLSRTFAGDAAIRVGHIGVDLATPHGIAMAEAIVAGEQPDILVNMAGVQYFGPAERQSSDELYAGYLVNLVAPAALCRAALPFMKARNRGQIVNLGSIFGSLPLAYFATYSSAKAGLRALSDALRRELAHTRIAVTYIAPRAVRTAMLTPEIEKYADLTRMNIDSAAAIAGKIVSAVKRRRKEVYFGFPERIFVRVNAVSPRLVDAAVAGADRKTMKLFA